MSQSEAFKLEVGSGAVMGTIWLPEAAAAGFRVGAVIVCHGVSAPGESSAEFLDELPASLTDVGLACVRFEHRCADLILEDFDAHGAGHDLEDALAVHRWLGDRSDMDASRIGVMGYSLGAIAATAIAKRLECVNRLCLVAPATARHVRAVFGTEVKDTAGEQEHRLPASYVPSLEDVDSAAEAVFHNRPTLILHGAADHFIEPAVSVEYQRALEMAGRPVESMLIARADHGFSELDGRRACLDRVAKFFAAMELAEPDAAESAAATP